MAASPLEGFGNATWVCFQRALVVRDIFTGGKRTFFSREDAQDFRARIYARNGSGRLCLLTWYPAHSTHRCSLLSSQLTSTICCQSTFAVQMSFLPTDRIWQPANPCGCIIQVWLPRRSERRCPGRSPSSASAPIAGWSMRTSSSTSSRNLARYSILQWVSVYHKHAGWLGPYTALHQRKSC